MSLTTDFKLPRTRPAMLVAGSGHPPAIQGVQSQQVTAIRAHDRLRAPLHRSNSPCIALVAHRVWNLGCPQLPSLLRARSSGFSVSVVPTDALSTDHAVGREPAGGV